MQEFLEKKIIISDNQETLALLGEADEYLKILGKGFSCKIVSGGNELVICGAAQEVCKADKIVGELLFLHNQGSRVTPHEIRYSVRMANKGKEDCLRLLFQDTVLVSAKGRQIKPKTEGQRVYLDAIRQRCITLGIGPAGTGKTYLAVVMAVTALRDKEVEKIILTRSAVESGERLGFLPGDLQDKVNPYLCPLYDALYDILGAETHRKLMTKHIIEVADMVRHDVVARIIRAYDARSGAYDVSR